MLSCMKYDISYWIYGGLSDIYFRSDRGRQVRYFFFSPMAMTSCNQPSQYHRRHESEWIYASFLSRQFFTPMNDCIHQKLSLGPSSSSLLELYFAMCGYAFNPVMFPIWPMLVYTLSIWRCCPTSDSSVLYEATVNSSNWRQLMSFHHCDHRHPVALRHTALYLTSVVLTLAFTEIGKALFSTSRPRPPSSSGEGCWLPTRKYEQLVSSLKSKHSFPSGDCAQAMNFCMIVCKYLTIPDGATAFSSFFDGVTNSMKIWNNDTTIISFRFMINVLLFGVFLPSVAFARIYFRCHWIEDCIGGMALSWVLHSAIIPKVANQII